MPNIVEDFIESNDLTYQEILNTLLDGEMNLDLKTHIFRPKQLASLHILGELLKTYNYPKSSTIIENFLTKFLRFMVSFNRLSRKEIVDAIKSNLAEKKNEERGSPLTKNLLK